MKVAMLGAGSWGTTLADLLAREGHEVRIWGNVRADLAELEVDRENRKFPAGSRMVHRRPVIRAQWAVQG